MRGSVLQRPFMQEITKAINKQNEETAAGAADAAGGRLNVVRLCALPAQVFI